MLKKLLNEIVGDKILNIIKESDDYNDSAETIFKMLLSPPKDENRSVAEMIMIGNPDLAKAVKSIGDKYFADLKKLIKYDWWNYIEITMRSREDGFGIPPVGLDSVNIYDKNVPKLPQTFKHLNYSLSDLKIDSCNLVELPSYIGEFKRLKRLNLNNNMLTKLPSTIGGLKSIEDLSLFNNNLVNIPDSIGDLSNLETLDIGENNLTELPNSLLKLSKLEWLNIKNNIKNNNFENTPEIVEQLRDNGVEVIY